MFNELSFLNKVNTNYFYYERIPLKLNIIFEFIRSKLYATFKVQLHQTELSKTKHGHSHTMSVHHLCLVVFRGIAQLSFAQLV